MRRAAFFGIVTLLLAIGVPQLLAQNEPQENADVSSVLQVVDTEPLAGQELDLSGRITLYFDRNVDCATVQNAFNIVPAIAGDVSCDGTSITFTPDEEFDRANTYRISLNDALRGADGAQLLEPFQLDLDTVGFLGISETFPAPDAAVVETDTTVTIIFNRPVVPLVTDVDEADLVNPITVSPAVEGRGEWVNTSIYQFTPDEALAGSTTYTVTVNAGLTAQDGAVLPDDYVLTMTTQGPEIFELNPLPDARNIPLDSKIQVRFNQPMDRQSVEAGFNLQTSDGDAASGTFEWAEDDMGFAFTPDDPLLIEQTYSAGFDEPVVSANGAAPLEGRSEWTFVTVPLPAIRSTYPGDGSFVDPFGGFEINFASPMDTTTLEGLVTIEPATITEPDFSYREYSYSLYVSFLPYPDTDYTVTIAPGAQDIYGNTIDEEYTFTYRTGGYEPEVRLETPRNIGFYNAYRDPTSVFLAYRNVETIDLELYTIPLETFIGFASSDRIYALANNYNPGEENLLRRWTVESPAPANAVRFDLLELDNATQNVNCPGTLPSRLSVGDNAIVISDPDPVRARESAPDGEIVDLLYRDYALSVVGGGDCIDGLLWWEVELRDGRTVWVAESVDNEYLLDSRDAGLTTEVTVQASEDDAGLTPGIYHLSASSEQTRYYDPNHTMVVATANLMMKQTIDSVLVWATDVQSGEPIANAPIDIYGREGTVIASGVTDTDGLMIVETPRAPDLYVVRLAILNDDQHFGIGLAEWGDGIQPYNFGQNSDFYPSVYRAYMYTDRPIYRPGQPVYLRGIVRGKDDVAYTPPPFETVSVTVRDDRGEIVLEDDVQLTAYGSFSVDLTLADDASLGFYFADVELPGEPSYRTGGSVSFGVAEYRRPEFQVEVDPVEPEVVQGDMIEVTVDSTYFFGGPVANADVSYSVLSQDFFFRNEQGPRYDFTDSNYDGGASSIYESQFDGVIARGEATTDANGDFTIEVPADITGASQSQQFTIEAVVTDETDQAVAGRGSVIVHQGEVYIGVRPESYVGRAGDVSAVSVISLDWDNESVPNQAVDYEVVERRWSSVQERDSTGRTVWRYEVEEIPVEGASGSITTDANGNGTIEFTPPEGGVYKIIVRTRDVNGNEVVASTTMWVSSSRYVSWRQQNSNRIDLIADSDSYEVGDTAEVLITSPFQGTAEALITVERGDVLYTERVTMDSNSLLYRLPITEDFAPNIFVSVMIVKGVDDNNPVAGFRMGYIELGVDAERKQLNLDISSNVDSTSPQETVTYTITATDYAGDPVQAEIGVGVTDLAVLTLAPPNSRPIMNFFYGDQSLSVRTSTPLVVNVDQLTQEILDTVKGGGGGLAVDGLVEIRGEFIDTPYWNGALETDANGTVSFDVRLPDNLTTWRLDARAITLAADGEMLVGQETFDLLSTKPVLIRPVTPRFFVVGDRVVLAAVVNNNTDEDQRAVVTINASEGVSINDERAQVVDIPANSSARVEWNAVVNDADNVQMTFVADAGQFTDGSISPVSMDDEGTLPIYKYEVPATTGTAGTLSTTDSRLESIVLPRRFEVTQGELVIQVDQSLAGSTLEGLDYLKNYPHQCVEQTVSRFLPNIMTARALSQLDLQDQDLLGDSLDVVVNQALQKLFAEQKSDGGWGWFRNDRSNELTTAYALIGLYEAQQQGYPVSNLVISEAQRFLSERLQPLNDTTSFWRLNRQAFVLYALARTDAPQIGRTSNLYENRARLQQYARAYLAETLWYIDPTDTERIDTILSELANDVILSAAGAHWEEDQHDYWNWNTDTRTNAIVLGAFVKLRPNSDLIPNVVRYLMVQRSADAWETTQETAWVVMALTDWMVASGELQPDYDFDVSLNGETLADGTATADTVLERTELRVQVADLIADEANRLIFTRTGSDDGAMYYTAYLNAYLSVPEVEALDSGISISRRYTLQGSDEPITQGRVGDIVEVRLTIIAPNDLHYVVVEDPFPAGAEAIDPNLSTNQQVGTRPGLDNADPLRYGWGWWYFSEIDFRDEKMQMYSTYLPAGTYEYVYTMRLGVVGEYNVIPSTAQEFYFPDVYGRSNGELFTILPAEG